MAPASTGPGRAARASGAARSRWESAQRSLAGGRWLLSRRRRCGSLVFRGRLLRRGDRSARRSGARKPPFAGADGAKPDALLPSLVEALAVPLRHRHRQLDVSLAGAGIDRLLAASGKADSHQRTDSHPHPHPYAHPAIRSCHQTAAGPKTGARQRAHAERCVRPLLPLALSRHARRTDR